MGTPRLPHFLTIVETNAQHHSSATYANNSDAPAGTQVLEANTAKNGKTQRRVAIQLMDGLEPNMDFPLRRFGSHSFQCRGTVFVEWFEPYRKKHQRGRHTDAKTDRHRVRHRHRRTETHKQTQRQTWTNRDRYTQVDTQRRHTYTFDMTWRCEHT